MFRKRIDATQGPILSQMLIYGLPLLLSTIVQQLFNALDIAIVGKDTGDLFSTVKEICPDIIMLGYDQSFDEKELESQLREKGFNTRVMRATECSDDLNGTRRIVAKIIESSKKVQ